MKSTETFKQTILDYLMKRIEQDELFAQTYLKPNKNIDDCITYILNAVKESGCNGFTDEEIYSMAVHYYDEDNIDVGKPIDATVIVNHKVELTEEEIEIEKTKARNKVFEDTVNKMKKPTSLSRPNALQVKSEEKKAIPQQSLF